MKQFVPKEYRELLDYISPSAFRVVDWKSALGLLLNMGKRSFDKEHMQEIAQASLAYTSKHLTLVEKLEIDTSESTELDAAIGHHALDLYFSQFFSTEHTLIDLRPGCFRMSQQQCHYQPGRLSHEFSTSFKHGMLDIYAGYYLDQPEQLQSGLEAVGLTSQNDSDESKERITNLLLTHFGTADQGAITFSLKQFTESFHALFTYLKSQNKTLDSDFLFLGIYLVTLYQTLAKIPEPLDVREVFKATWKRNHKHIH